MDIIYNSILESKSIGFAQRIAIFLGLKRNDTITNIARELNFSRQAIHAEIKRGTIKQLKSSLEEFTTYDVYAAEYANERNLSRRGRLSKIDDHIGLYDFIRDKLMDNYSPEVISSLISKNDNFSCRVSPKTIYNWIYDGDLGVHESVLPYGRHKVKKSKKAEKNRIKPNGGESIELRPDISNREEFGHWEIDSIVGLKNGKSTSLMTLVERKTRYGIVIKIEKRTMKCVVSALKKVKRMYGKYFYDIFKTITADNGSEFKDAIGMSFKIKSGKMIRIYFSHAYSSWERGSNENFNKMVRRKHPKKTDFTKITQHEIDISCQWVNNYPRKQFGYISSKELFQFELNRIYTV